MIKIILLHLQPKRYVRLYFSGTMSCIIYKKSFAPIVQVKEKGLFSLSEFSQHRSENEGLEIFVHKDCRKWFNNKRRISTESEISQRKRRKSTHFSSWNTNCFLCDSACNIDRKNPSRRDWHFASSNQIRQKSWKLANVDLKLMKMDGL